MHDVKYVSYTKFVPHDEEEEEKGFIYATIMQN